MLLWGVREAEVMGEVNSSQVLEKDVGLHSSALHGYDRCLVRWGRGVQGGRAAAGEARTAGVVAACSS